MNKNIAYNSSQIADFYSQNRIRYKDFYLSEQHVFNRCMLSPSSRILDVGCGCGGLGLALNEEFGVTQYVGIEINSQAVTEAKSLYPEATFRCSDIIDINVNELGLFDTVCSLSCIDWNVELKTMLEKCWSFVKPNGSFILSLRLTDKASVLDISRSYQEISFDQRQAVEIAQYSVLNIDDCLSMLMALPGIDEIYAYGYNGIPSNTAVTPFKELCFAVFAITKGGNLSKPEFNLELPLEPKII